MYRKYYIQNSGDNSVGINGFCGDVVLNVDLDLDDNEFIAELDKSMKKVLVENFELETRCNIGVECDVCNGGGALEETKEIMSCENCYGYGFTWVE